MYIRAARQGGQQAKKRYKKRTVKQAGRHVRKRYHTYRCIYARQDNEGSRYICRAVSCFYVIYSRRPITTTLDRHSRNRSGACALAPKNSKKQNQHLLCLPPCTRAAASGHLEAHGDPSGKKTTAKRSPSHPLSKAGSKRDALQQYTYRPTWGAPTTQTYWIVVWHGKIRRYVFWKKYICTIWAHPQMSCEFRRGQPEGPTHPHKRLPSANPQTWATTHQ